MKRRLDNRLYYFTVEDESLLAEPKESDTTRLEQELKKRGLD